MHSSVKRFNRVTSGVILTALLLTGCETTSNWLKGRQTAVAEDPVFADAPDANVYLTELQQLAGGDPATQAEIFADARAAAQLTPDASTRLRYALVLATPGHGETSAAEAQSLLREVLAQTALMTATEVALGQVFLKDVEARIVLDNELRRLRAESTRAASTEDAAIAERIARVEAENRRLRESLSDAESKLEAITTIERSIREQADGSEPR